MEKIEIRKVKENEVEKLQYIGQQTFKQTFEDVNSEEDMETYLKNSFSLEKLKEELNNINSEFYFAIEKHSNIVGYLKINTGKAQTEIQDNKSLEIERIYVLKEYQKQKIGKQLFEKALHIALERKMYYMWLGVWEKNEKAISFYKKNDFIEFDKHIFKLGSDEQTDIMMKKELINISNFNIQPTLENDKIILLPLQENDFEVLYKAASDPKIWEQHPNKDRWKKEVFQVFFDGAMQSKGAFKILDKRNEQVIGSTRFYNYDSEENSILIGFTFYTTSCWGKGINPMVKKLMLDYIFQFVSIVYFHVGAKNIRSQIAVERLGAKKIKEEEVTYSGEVSRLNFIYKIEKNNWKNRE